MLVSSLFIGLLSNSDHQYKFLSWSLGVAGLFYLLIYSNTNTVLFTAITFCFFLTLPFVDTSLEVLFRQNIANEVQGRIWFLISLISQIGMLMALSITGVLADHLSNPLLIDNGCLAETVGSIIGTGSARGSGLMVIISVFFSCGLRFIPQKEEETRKIKLIFRLIRGEIFNRKIPKIFEYTNSPAISW